MNIAFITSHLKTALFLEIAGRLENREHTVYWLSSGHRWSAYLERQGVIKDRILDEAEWGEEWTNGSYLESGQTVELENLERESGLSVNEVITMDRLLKHRPYNVAVKYIYVIQREISKFLRTHEIQIVFCEPTWTHEIVAGMVCKSLGVAMYNPSCLRIPNDRFTFFRGHIQEEMADIRQPDDNDRQQAEKYYRHFVSVKPKPAYWHINNRIPSVQLNWVSKLGRRLLLQRMHRFDETAFPARWLLKRRCVEVLNASRLRLSRVFENPAMPPRKPYVLYPLHKQPESSIDVLGSRFSNQVELIRTISRSLPVTHELVVKEHQNCIGDNSVRFYRCLKAIPGVRLINPYIPSHELVVQSSLVISVSGTMAFEAGLLGKPAITLVPMFFGSILEANGCNPYDKSFRTMLNRILSTQCFEGKLEIDLRNIDFFSRLYANSFRGIIGNIELDSRCMESNNLDDLANGFHILLTSQEVLSQPSLQANGKRNH